MSKKGKIIISDAGPLIALSRIDRLSLLSELFGQLIIPKAVFKECMPMGGSRPGALGIQQALTTGKLTIQDIEPSSEGRGLFEVLGAGEAAAIMLASSLKGPLLIDEKLGRRVAEKMELKIIGTAGVLLLAKKRKIIGKVKPIIYELKQAGYHLAEPLITYIVKQAKET